MSLVLKLFFFLQLRSRLLIRFSLQFLGQGEGVSSPGITLLWRQVRDGTEYKSCFTARLPLQVVFQSFPSTFSAPLLKSKSVPTWGY